MNTTKRTTLGAIIVGALISAFVAVYFLGTVAPSVTLGAGGATFPTAPTFIIATSTAYTVTNTSSQILATTTLTKRMAVTIQPINCAAGAVFLAANADVAAVANTGLVAYASSTLALTDYPEIPAVQGAIRAITNSGSCTVLVTEWKSRN